MVIGLKSCGKLTAKVATLTDVSERTIMRAIERGFEPNRHPLNVLDRYIIDTLALVGQKTNTRGSRVRVSESSLL